MEPDDDDPTDWISSPIEIVEDTDGENPPPDVSAGIPTQPASGGGEHMGASPQSPMHSELGPVMRFFQSIIKKPPPLAGLLAIRGLFPCTGPVTRNEKRTCPAMAAAFEAHSAEVLTALQDRELLWTVAWILANASKRQSDSRTMKLAAGKYFHMC
jgi:hypothetical protein